MSENGASLTSLEPYMMVPLMYSSSVADSATENVWNTKTVAFGLL